MASAPRAGERKGVVSDGAGVGGVLGEGMELATAVHWHLSPQLCPVAARPAQEQR